MNIRWVVLFAAVADEGSFTRAAARLNIAQPWLSAQLRKLEFELGVRLLERLNAGVELTPEGRELLPYARQVADASKKFRDLARTMGDVQSHMVRIGSHLPMVNIPALRRLNDDFTRRYPNFSIRGTAGITPELLSELNEGQFDVIVALSPVADAENYEYVRLDAVSPYLLFPRASSFAGGGVLPSDLSGHQIAAPPPASQPALYDKLFEPLRRAGATIRPVPEPDKRAMEHFARAHDAIVLMIEGNAGDYAGDPALTAIALPDVEAEHLLIRVRGRELGRAAERHWTMAMAIGAEKS
jgi:DNA-binding transcriptional LysR family regulator